MTLRFKFPEDWTKFEGEIARKLFVEKSTWQKIQYSIVEVNVMVFIEHVSASLRRGVIIQAYVQICPVGGARALVCEGSWDRYHCFMQKPVWSRLWTAIASCIRPCGGFLGFFGNMQPHILHIIPVYTYIHTHTCTYTYSTTNEYLQHAYCHINYVWIVKDISMSPLIRRVSVSIRTIKRKTSLAQSMFAHESLTRWLRLAMFVHFRHSVMINTPDI